VVYFEQTRSWLADCIAAMYTSAECRKIAQTKIAKAKRLRDKRRADRLISAANAWLDVDETGIFARSS
jgi:hypothetical protein